MQIVNYPKLSLPSPISLPFLYFFTVVKRKKKILKEPNSTNPLRASGPSCLPCHSRQLSHSITPQFMDAGFVDRPNNLGMNWTLLATHAEKLHKWQWKTEHETDTEMFLHVQEEQGPSSYPVYLDYLWQVALISMELLCYVRDSYTGLCCILNPAGHIVVF